MRKGWKVYCIKDLGKVVTGSTPSTKNGLNYSSNDYSFVKPSDISQSQISYIDETECYVSEYAFQNSRILPSGAVLVTCIGIIGKVGIVVNDCICNQQINAIIPNEKVNNKFLAYSIFSKKDMLSLIANSPVVPIINKNDFSNIKLSVPHFQTQQQIVEELDCLTSIIEKQKKQLEELDNLAQAIFYDMFGDPIENEKGWNSETFGNLFLLRSGDSLPAKKQIPGNFNVYGGNGINGTHIEFNREGEVIIIGRVGAYCGNVRIVKGAFWLTDNAFELILIKERQNTIYLLFLLRLINLFRFANKVAQPVISNVVLRDIMIPLPPLSLQQQFASKIEAIEKQKELIKKSIKETEDLFNNRMDYYFN